VSNPVRGILLDFYGTVVHEDDVNIAAITAQMHAHSRSGASASEIGAFWYETFFDWCKRSAGDTFVSQRYLAVETLRETIVRFDVALDPAEVIAPQLAHWQEPPIFEDALEFLGQIASLGIRVCVASNVDREDISSAIAHHGLAIDAVVTSEDARSYKPRPELFHLALDAIRLGPADILHIGDSVTSDVRGAQALGIPVAWINRSGKPHPRDPQPDWEISFLTDLLPVIHERLL
jgi:2-haloacid dehalogenase